MSLEQKVFFALVRAGLWGDVKVNGYRLKVKESAIDWGEIMRLAEEQAVVGLVAEGIEQFQVSGSWTSQAAEPSAKFQVPQEWALQFIGQTLQIEQRNMAMNAFVAELIERLRKADIYAILVKGQGIAQCYEKPLWRSSGDVDLLLSDTNYEKAKALLVPLASDVEKEFLMLKHQGMTINGFIVELHGTLRSRLTKRIDREIDKVQDECFLQGEVRSWMNGKTQVFLPGPNQDVIFVFTHILHHLFIEGIGLRQICDWCRLLWTYRDKIDKGQLEKHLKAMGLLSEWKAFFTLATKYLGMPEEVSSFMFQDSRNSKWGRKADRLLAFILETGNFGHNRVKAGEGMFKTLLRRTSDAFTLARVFPLDAWKMYFGMIRTGLILRAE